MSVISSVVFPEYLLTQLQQSADAVVRRLKSLFYLHRNSGWYINGSGNYAVRAHITYVEYLVVTVFLTIRTGATALSMFFTACRFPYLRELQVVETHTFMPAVRHSTRHTYAIVFLCALN